MVLAFNEERTLGLFVQEVIAVTRRLERECEILVVDDGSTDRTGAIADQLAREIAGIRVIHHETNRGLGEGYRTGFANARGECITFLGGDGQFPAVIIPQFFRLMAETDMVLGYVPHRKGPLGALAFSFFERVLYQLLFGPLPRFQGVVMFKRRLLDKIPLKSTGRGWTVLMELIIRTSRGGDRILSVPTPMSPRMWGKSKVLNLSTVWSNLSQTLALRLTL